MGREAGGVNCRGGGKPGKGRREAEEGERGWRRECQRREHMEETEKADGGEQKGESWAAERFGSC